MNVTVMVNAHAATPHCYVGGHWGQYGLDRLADLAEEFGWTPDSPLDDPRILRAFAEYLDEVGDGCGEITNPSAPLWERHIEAGNKIEEWFNENTAPVCPHCRGPLYATSDGFYRHLAFPTEAARLEAGDPCEFSAIDSPWFPRWEWQDGEFFLNIYDDEGEYLEPDQLEGLSK